LYLTNAIQETLVTYILLAQLYTFSWPSPPRGSYAQGTWVLGESVAVMGK